MPDNVDLNRFNIKRSHNGWKFRRHNARSKFICMYCRKNKLNGWTSVYTTILFRARLDKSHCGQNIGRIQMKIFEQGCQLCNRYSTALFDEKEIKKTIYWLYIWILNTFYNVKLIDDDNEQEDSYNQANGFNRGLISHDSNRCDGCRVGWCKYLYKNRNINTLKRHTIMFN